MFEWFTESDTSYNPFNPFNWVGWFLGDLTNTFSAISTWFSGLSLAGLLTTTIPLWVPLGVIAFTVASKTDLPLIRGKLQTLGLPSSTAYKTVKTPQGYAYQIQVTEGMLHKLMASEEFSDIPYTYNKRRGRQL